MQSGPDNFWMDRKCLTTLLRQRLTVYDTGFDSLKVAMFLQSQPTI